VEECSDSSTPPHAVRVMKASTQDLRQYLLDQASSLGQVALIALSFMMDDAGVDEKWELPLQKRLHWVDGHKWTLGDAAGLVGVTRERMRQVQNQVDDIRLTVTVPPKVFYKVLALRPRVKSIDEFWTLLRAEGLSGPEEDWSKESLTKLFLKLGNSTVVEDLGRLFRELSPPPPSRTQNTTIRNARIKLFGTVNLWQAAEHAGLEVQDVVHILKQLYDHVFENGRMALAVRRPPAAFVDTVAKQLLVNPDATIPELYEGVRRQMSFRGVTQEFTLSQFREVAEMIFGDPASVLNIPHALQYEIKISEHEVAFLEAFDQSARRTLHRNELIEAASARGLNPTSAGVYLSTSPIIRPSQVKRGYFRSV